MKEKPGRRRLIIALIVSAVFTLMCTGRISAADASADKAVTLSVTYKYDNIKIPGINLHLYYMGETASDGSLIANDNFSKYRISSTVNLEKMTAAQIKTAAETLAAYVLQDKLSDTDMSVTDADGVAKFPSRASLKQGYYLLTMDDTLYGGYIYSGEPTIVRLPSLTKDGYKWDVDAEIKPSRRPVIKEISKDVMKVWNDCADQRKRPTEIKINLLKDGEVYDTVTLNEVNGWAYSWSKLDGSASWTVTEDQVDGYITSISQSGNTFIVTNTRDNPDKPDDSTVPEEVDTPTSSVTPPDTKTPTSSTPTTVIPNSSTTPARNVVSTTTPSSVVTTPSTTTVTSPPSNSVVETKTSAILPQTGMMWLPIPILAVSGVILIALGAGIRKKAQEK